MAPPIEVAIVGGGIGGLATAISLGRLTGDKFSVHIYEAAPAFGEIGVGVGLGPNAVRVLKMMGADVYKAYAEVADIGYSTYSPEYHWTNPEYRDAYTGKRILTSEYQNGTNVHRSNLLNMLVSKLPASAKVTFGAKVGHVCQEGEKVKITYNQRSVDGSETVHVGVADVCIGADGIKSATRAALFPNAQYVYSGTYAYRAVVPMDKFKEAVGPHIATVPHVHMGYKKHLLCYPINRGALLNAVLAVSDRSIPRQDCCWPEDKPWALPVSNAEVLAEFDDCSEAVKAVAKLMVDPIRWAMFEVGPLEYWSKGRILLLGDAAHSMVPWAGAGAGQALEDAMTLSLILSSPFCTASTVPSFLAACDVVRRPRANRVQEISYELGELYQLEGENGKRLDPVEELASLHGRRDFITRWDINRDVMRAWKDLKKSGIIPVDHPLVLNGTGLVA